jgi:hypothetical protein
LGRVIKPDIFNGVAKTFAEIKPLWIYGIVTGVEQRLKYSAALLPLGYSWETWPETPPFISVDGTPLTFFNAGGLIFYTDNTQNTVELTALVALAARNGVKINLPMLRQSLGFALKQAPRLALASRGADSARLQNHLGIASLLALYGVF